MNDNQVMLAMHIDDTYKVERVLTQGVGGVTELVTIAGAGPFIRKKIPSEIACRRVWSALAECSCKRLPHVAATYELPEEFVVVYDFVPGESLERHVQHQGPMGYAEAVRVICELCEAVAALHQLSVIHRDITPANVILSADGAHLIDLGIARLRVEGVTHDTASLGTWGVRLARAVRVCADRCPLRRVFARPRAGLCHDGDTPRRRYVRCRAFR